MWVQLAISERKRAEGVYTKTLARSTMPTFLSKIMKPNWHSGYNLAGFLSDPDVVACSPTWQEAADHLTSTMVEYADADDDNTYADRFPENMTAEAEEAWWNSDEVPAMRATADSILKDDPPQPEKDYSVTIEDGRLRHVCFWLMRVTCACEEMDS